jgi:DNA-binding response OmpR family regulator
VDDDLRIAELMRDVFIEGGFDVNIAINGLLGLKVFNEYQPDIVITDVKMPEMDGIQMVQELRRRYGHIRVIFITSWYEEEEIAVRIDKELAENPHYRLLKKPFKIEEVWLMADEYLRI